MRGTVELDYEDSHLNPWRELSFLATTFILALLILHGFLAPGYPPSWGGDAYGHLFKIEKLMGGYHPWIEDWYGGYPFLRFYPPLAYYAASVLGLPAHSAVIGYKATALLALVLGAYSARLLLRRLGFPDAPAYMASLAYAFAPYHLRILSPEANLPRFMGVLLAPLFMLALIYVFEGGRWKPVLAGILFATILLTHHTVAATLALSMIVVTPFLWIRVGGRPRRLLEGVAVSAIVAVLVSAFWLIPFIVDHGNAYFLEENKIDYLFKFQSSRIEDILLPGGAWSFYQGLILYLGLMGALAYYRRDRLLSATILIGILVPLILSLGYYGPTPWLNKLPILDLIPPYRWLDAVELFSSIGFAMLSSQIIEAGRKTAGRRWASIIILALLLAASLSDARYRISSLEAEEFPGDYLAVLNYIGNDQGKGWRFYQWGLATTQGSRIAYAPLLAGKPALDGWYRQGDPAYPQHSYLGYAVLHDKGYAEAALRAYSVKYVILDEKLRDTVKAEENLEEMGFKEVYEAGTFKLYEWSNYTFLTPRLGVLVVGSWPLDLGVDYEVGKFIDDYASHLSDYSLIILNGYKYRDPTVWIKLEEYVEGGGTLIVNTFRTPDAEGVILGVRSMIVRVNGTANLTSPIYDTTRFSNFTYEGGAWVATAYTGDLKPLVKMGNLTVLGVKEIGEGRVYFVGLNLPYHAVYTGNSYEASILANITSKYITPPRLNYTINEIKDGEITFNYTLDRDSMVLASENYYPYWKAYIDGAPTQVEKDDKYGLIMIKLPKGSHEVKLVFHDPYQPLKYISLASLIAVIVLYAWSAGRKRH